MIEFDQPKIFRDKIVSALSSADDGDMKFGILQPNEVVHNRKLFLGAVGVDPIQTTLIQASYEDNTDFTRYITLDDDHQGEGMLSADSYIHADAAVVTRPGHAIFLPLADCVGAIIYDPVNGIMMVSHLGRHSVEQDGAKKSINYLVENFDTNPADLLIWLSPSVGSDTYPLYKFGDRALQDVAVEHLLYAGVAAGNIEASVIDTAESENYFSHSEYLAGERDTDGRFAILAMMVR